jgi:hypothetical protein
MRSEDFHAAVLRNPVNDALLDDLFISVCPMRGSYLDAWSRRCGICGPAARRTTASVTTTCLFTMTFDDVRSIALAWPEVEDGTSYGTPALKVRKKMLVRLKEDGDSLVMPGVPPDERDMLAESQPKLFYFTEHYRDYPMVLIRLSKAKRGAVEPLLRRRWQALASKAARKAGD